MKQNNTLRLVMTAMFAAIICVATMSIRIPTPGTGGYIHPGDAFVILAGILFGPVPGLLAAGIGSALADMLAGYYIYIPITFVVKGAMAWCVAIAFKKMQENGLKKQTSCIICGIIATVIVACGYFAFETLIYGPGAIASVPANIIQGLSGLIISNLLYPIFDRLPMLKEIRA